jgi:hypothetical protein
MIPPLFITDWQLPIGNELISTVRQHRHDAVMVRLRDEHIDIEVPLSLIGLLGQYVPRMRMATLDFSGSRESHSLGRTFMCF